MNVGDQVKWRHLTNGIRRIRHGRIAAVVPPGVMAHEVLPQYLKNYAAKELGRRPQPRDHESFVVVVEQENRLYAYWPRVERLERA